MTLIKKLLTGTASGIVWNVEGGGGSSPAPAPEPAPAPDPAPAPAPAPAPKPWYEDRAWSDPTLKDHLVKSGYGTGTMEEALERALRSDASAQSKLGKAPSQLLEVPAADKPLTDWLKTNAKAFGTPDSADKYEIKLPEGMPEGMPINQGMLDRYKARAAEKGIPQALVQDAVDFFAADVGAEFTQIAAKAALAEQNLTSTLQAEWGANYQPNQQLAARAFQAIAAQMKLSPEQTQVMGAKLNEGMGDATLVKFFHHLAGKMGEDTLAIPRGADSAMISLTTAQSRKEAIMAPHTGDMAAAVKSGDQARINTLKEELKGLNAIITR